MRIHAHKSNFVDDLSRRVMLRGVNLSGSSKVPFTPNGASHIREGFFDHRNVSFVGRPFTLDQADEHLGRLREWGFNFLRLLVTWEAIEHAGPGIYDEAYLDYIVWVVEKAAQYDFNLLIDPHQDVWSRFSGGDGAPGWTLEAVGFDITHFAETGAAIVHATHGDLYPRMIWSSNESKLACATMFTLFFAGNDFAPLLSVDGEPIQEYLQRHYIEAIRQVARRLKDQPNVLGYDTLNEPSAGYIGWKDLNAMGGAMITGDVPTPFQSMLLGEGFRQDIAVWRLGDLGFKRTGFHTLNGSHQRAWKDGSECIWKRHGVWEVNSSHKPILLRPDYFASRDGKPVNFAQDYYRPFANRYATAIQAAHPGALIFIETGVDLEISEWGEGDTKEIVYAPHWYDWYLTGTKKFSNWIGVDAQKRKIVFGAPFIRRNFRQQLARQKQIAERVLGDVPVVLGELGIPFDLDEKRAYRTGNFHTQVNALQRCMEAIEGNLLDYALWVYTPDNSNLHGDLWNDEDFSIYSIDQRAEPSDINSGGRALQAVLRPYPMATAGELLRSGFNAYTRIFRMVFRQDPAISAPTEIYVPKAQYPQGYQVQVSDGRYEKQYAKQKLLYWPDKLRRIHKITVKP